VDFIDTHSHLYLSSLQDDLENVLQRAGLQGVNRFIVPGIDLKTSRLAVDMAEKYPGIYAAVGVHPNDGLTWDDGTLDELEQLLRHERVVAVGEIGLDYYREHTPHAVQIEILHQQLALAARNEKPVIIHCRQAMDDLWPIIKSWQMSLSSSMKKRPGVFHSFDSDLIIANEIIGHHFYIGVSGPVTYKNAFERQQTIGALPLENLVLETDAPFLTPHPLRGRVNEPANISLIAKKVAELLNLPVEKVAEMTLANAKHLFEWIG